MNDLEDLFLNGQLNANKLSERINFFNQEDKYNEAKQLIEDIVIYIKAQIDLWNKWNQMLYKSPYLDKKYDYLKMAANTRETISNFKKSLKYMEDWQRKISLDHLKADKINIPDKNIFETGMERFITFLENKSKIDEAQKSTSNVGSYKIKINEKKNYTKKEAAKILGLKSTRRVDQIMEKLGIEFEKEKRGRENLISGKNLKKIKKSRE
ncbi:MAG: hypothetical protein ABII93_07730 [Chrysiogenia bacterium]